MDATDGLDEVQATPLLPHDDERLQRVLRELARLSQGTTDACEQEAEEFSRLLAQAVSRQHAGGSADEDAATADRGGAQSEAAMQKAPPLPEHDLQRVRRAASSSHATRISLQQRKRERESRRGAE